MRKKSSTDEAATRIFGSDVIADALQEQGIPYLCINPGASFRGLHDSIVNHIGNANPKIIVCLHEEHAVAICHGFAAVTNRPLAAAVHSNVGLMHATMAIFNAWCARIPMLVIGATGPVDAAKRRPWIDWIHTAADQGALVRDYTKWDDQPSSAEAAVESIRRAMNLARTSPCGPTYVNLDAAIQEVELDVRPQLDSIDLFPPPEEPEPAAADVAWLYGRLRQAKNIVFLSGRMRRAEYYWNERRRLAELFNAKVITSSGDAGSFDTAHPLHLGEAGMNMTPAHLHALKVADIIVSLDWVDLKGALNPAFAPGSAKPCIVSISNDFHIHRGWSMDYQALPAVSRHLATTPEAATTALLNHMSTAASNFDPRLSVCETANAVKRNPSSSSGAIGVMDLARVFDRVAENIPTCLVSRPIGWPLDGNRISHPLDYLGHAGGGGLGAGPGVAIGAALALRDMKSERIPVAILGDGDYLMGVNALWTAASEKIPLLIIIADNGSYYNDEAHQERVALMRGRSIENAWVGQRLENPSVDLSAMARAQGLVGMDTVEELEKLEEAIKRAFDAVREGKPSVLPIKVKAEYVRQSLRRSELISDAFQERGQ